MTKKLLTLILTIFISSTLLAQVTAGQIDDFQDGTEQNWKIGNPGGALFPPANVTNGGPLGAGDNFLEYTSAMPLIGGAGTKMVIFNKLMQWSGNFTAQSVIAIKMDISVLTADLNIRIAFEGPGGTHISTINAINVVAGSGWNFITIPIQPSDFTIVDAGGGATINDVLAGVVTMRILSSGTPSWSGETIDATLRLDNITASTTLSVNDNNLLNSFSISPNPGRDKLNLKLNRLNNTVNLEVFDVLGKKIFVDRLTKSSTSVDVSQWNSGVYLVRLTTDTGTQTKRFVKQ